MTPQEIKTLRDLMEYEAQRTAPPEGFPRLPVAVESPQVERSSVLHTP